ncbi:MAG TPA: DUF6597 domain-containing transcriptional factor, partial [Thermoanaerobaculia bacterium]|nr:DUF6597 domain-containing transcriptional factor [Thermoanaerobaculia bacterium]
MSAMLLEVAPSAALRDWVECFWHRPAEAAGTHRVLPDGCADLLVDVARGELSIVGTMTAPIVLEGRHPELLGVRFRPGRAAALLRTPLHELTDLRVEVADRTLQPRG